MACTTWQEKVETRSAFQLPKPGSRSRRYATEAPVVLQTVKIACILGILQFLIAGARLDRVGLYLGFYERPANLLAKGSPKKPQFAISDVLVWDDISQQVHPNQKPLGVISRLISTYSVEKASILDPFCGSGDACRCPQFSPSCCGH